MGTQRQPPAKLDFGEEFFGANQHATLTVAARADIHANMLSPSIEKILILQERDMRRAVLDSQLKAVPSEIASVRRKIEEEKAAADSAKAEWKNLETRRKGLENEVTSGEEKIAKFRSQQLMVKKNDEYQALGHEIEHAQAAIEKLEEEEIGIMFELDTAKGKIAAAEAVAKGNIAGHEARITQLQERERNLATELESETKCVEEARTAVEPGAQTSYARLSKNVGLPVCVPLKEHKCGGCHLKVSSGVESETRSGGKLAFCDNCGRILYWEIG
jgi:predicted  nucleic acid-binding Zn-ribbon protein